MASAAVSAAFMAATAAHGAPSHSSAYRDPTQTPIQPQAPSRTIQSTVEPRAPTTFEQKSDAEQFGILLGIMIPIVVALIVGTHFTNDRHATVLPQGNSR